ncbi:MAG: hypothetical protein HF962_07005 [Sulfurovum sp.]|nr:hypothetical protein [Sulfurovum sp.]
MTRFRVLLLLVIALLTQVHADFKNELENTYVRGINSILFLTSEDIISAGSYEFGSSSRTLDTHILPFTHHFKSDVEFYNFYVNGGVGFSKYRESDMTLRSNSSDKIKRITDGTV